MSSSTTGLTRSEKADFAKKVAKNLDDWLPEQLAESAIPGVVVAVVDDREIVWQREFGRLDHPGSPRVNPETLFCVRSLAKGFTAIAVLVGVQEGLLDLDTPINAYLPEFSVHSRFDPHPEELITLRHLLAHWAGFTHDEPPGYDLDDPYYFQEHIERISHTWLRFPVGYRYAYTNLDYDLAGYILQVRSRMPFAQYMKEKVLEPLGMTSSSYDIGVVGRTTNRAPGHAPNGKIEALQIPEMPAAGLYSNLPDMGKYIQFHLSDGKVGDHRYLHPDLMQEYHTIQFARSNQQTGYCFGIFRQLISNTYSYSHSGGGHGFQSQGIVYPELGFGLILLTNKDGHGLTEGPLQKIVDDLVRDRFGPNPSHKPPIESMREIPPDDARIRSILGRYYDGDNWAIGIENGVPVLRTSPQATRSLTFYEDDGELVGIYGETNEIRFLPPYADQGGALVSINSRLLNCNFRSFNDSPADPPGPGESAWKAYIGEYDILWDDEPFVSVSSTLKNGYLYFGEAKCIEYEPGLFFTCDGEALDFRSLPPTAANLVMRRKGELII
jgi:CubicO group peptidase (beta-lactamase class C family)